MEYCRFNSGICYEIVLTLSQRKSGVEYVVVSLSEQFGSDIKFIAIPLSEQFSSWQVILHISPFEYSRVIISGQ